MSIALNFMLTLPLEPTDDRASPAFTDAIGCTAWLNQLQLTNLQLAHSRLLAQINELNRFPMRGVSRLETLEALRETVAHLQGEYAKKLIAKPLPLLENERMIFLSLIGLWQAMVTGYQRGLQAAISGEKHIGAQLALLCQRCLHYSGLIILEYQNSGYQAGPECWRQLHELYDFSAQQKFKLSAVADPLSAHPTHCSATYLKILLACYANPAQMSTWQVQQMNEWLALWSTQISLSQNCILSRNDAQPLIVDLSSALGLQRAEGSARHGRIRYLGMVPLSKLLRVKTILLNQDPAPQEEQHNDCLDLLNLLHRRWCENRRTVKRRTAALQVALCTSPFHVHDMLFSPAAKNSTGVFETWELNDESIMGAHLSRTQANGERFRDRQLIALRPRDLLAATAWARVTLQGVLEIGVKYFPGRPEAIQIRPYGINSTGERAKAFLLPALTAIKTPASLILPRHWAHEKRIVELIHADQHISIVQLELNLEQGLNYERVSFTDRLGE